MADPAELAFLANAAARGEELLTGLSWLASQASGLSLPGAAVLGLAGALLLAVGARHRRFIGVVGGGAVGALAALAAGGWLRTRWPGLPLPALVASAAAGLAVLGGLFPPIFVCLTGALPGAVLGVAAPIADQPLYGLVAGAAALGALALWGPELVAVAVASTLGAGLLGGALLAAAGPRPEVSALAARPFLLLAWLVVVGAAGGALQLGQSWGKGTRRSGSGRGGDVAPVSPPDRPAGRAARSPGSRP
jgi:hypothetical protein